MWRLRRTGRAIHSTEVSRRSAIRFARIIPGFKDAQTSTRGNCARAWRPNGEKVLLLLAHCANGFFARLPRLSAEPGHLYQESIDTYLRHVSCQRRAG